MVEKKRWKKLSEKNDTFVPKHIKIKWGNCISPTSIYLENRERREYENAHNHRFASFIINRHIKKVFKIELGMNCLDIFKKLQYICYS